MLRKLLVCLFMFAFTVSCGSSSEISSLISAVEGGTSKSADGSLTLDIPPGALAEDTEIRVSRVAEGDLDRDEFPELATFILEPSGTAFSNPVEVTIVLPLSLLEPGFRVINMASEVTAESAQDTLVGINVDEFIPSDDGSDVTLVMEISHFSRLIVIGQGYFEATLSVPERAVIGVPFTATAITRNTGTGPQVLSRHVLRAGDTTTVETVTIRPATTWDLTGNFWGENISPRSLDNAPANTPVSSGSFTSPASFTCRVEGNFVLRFRADITLDETWEYKYSPELFGIIHDRSSDWFSSSHDVAKASGECVLPPTPTPARTSGYDGLTNSALGFSEDTVNWVAFEQNEIVLRINQIEPVEVEVEDFVSIYSTFDARSTLDDHGGELRDPKIEFTAGGPITVESLGVQPEYFTVESEIFPGNEAVIWGFHWSVLTCLSEGEGVYHSTLTGTLSSGETITQTVSGLVDCEEPPATVAPDALPVIRQVYTIDGRPYDRVQFQYDDGHDGCGLPHVHSNVTVYPFQNWNIRGFPDAPLQTTGDAPLTDPDPQKCGFGTDISLKNPSSVVVPARLLLEPCARIEVDRIDTASEVEARNLSHWTDLCDSLGG